MNRNLSPNVAKGMYGGPRQIKGGDYSRANMYQTSGAVTKEASSVNGNAALEKKVPRTSNKKY
jgi:hypothetical protein